MTINPFKLERYFAEYEFKARYLLSPSDCESLGMADLLKMANPEIQQLWEDLRLGYTESQGNPLLRAEIARFYPGIPSEGIIVAAPEEAIYISMVSILKPGDHVVVISPAYQSLYDLARSIGCEVTFWPIQAQGDCWFGDLALLEDTITAKTKMLVVNFPHNPTGYLPSVEDFKRIVNLARRRDIYLFSDEMYRLLEYNPQQRLPAVCTLYEKGISLSGLSKSLALPGLRIGWLATHNKTAMNLFATFKDYTTICNSAPSEILAIIALQAKEAILERNLAIIKANLEHLDNFFKRYADFMTWMSPQAGSVAFPLWTGPVPVETICQQILEKKGVMIVPGSIFDDLGSHFRIGLGRKDLPSALEQVGEYLDQM